MAIKPTIEKEIDRGTGKIGSELDYLKVDPTTYFYNKFKSGAMSKFVRDDMWTEASIRGETNALINILSGIEKAAQTQTIDTSLLDKYEWYENQGYGDYDTYMFALGLPTYDDTKKVERINEITGESFGSYTDKEYAEMILNSTFQRYDAEMVEAEKEKRNKLVQFGIDLGVGIASTFTNIVSGVGNWLNDMYNIGEGLINLIANWSNDDSAGARFLWAFANDQEDPSLFKQLSDFNQEISYKLAYEYSTAVNAVEAYEQGYIPNEWGEYLGTGWRTEGNKVYRGFGAMWNGVTTSIGYMLPSIITAQVAGLAGAPAAVVKGLGSGAMYTGIASSNITETIEASGLNYKNLNAGNVISNAIIKAGVQYGIELALGKVLGFFSVSERLRGLGTTSVKNAVKIGSTEAKAFGIMLGRGIKGAAKEGLEETLQDLSDGIIDTVYSSFSGQLNEVYKANGAETISFNNLLQSFIAGALTEGIVGTIHTAFWSPGVDEKGNKIEFVGEREGKTFKLGKFQSMNFAQALAAMNEWNDTLNNANATKEEKANAAMKMSATINSVGDILGKFGTLDAIKANNLLLAQADNRAKREAIAKLSNTEYAKSLYDSFLKTYSSIKADYETQKEKKGDGLLNKIKAAIKNLLPKFKENNIDKLDGDIVTTTIESDNPNIGISQDAYAKLKGVLVNDLGAEALIGINGDMVAKSEGIIFVPNQWLIDGDVPKIIQALGYEDVRQAVKTALGASQRKRILNTYAKVVGKEATIDQAIDALLFDKIFYTKILLMTEEKTKTSKQEAIELLATIDNLIKSKGAEAVQKGTLERAAYNTLLNKVYQTMRTGLIVYATHYARLDLGAISNAVLPADIKTEISNHRNVIFSNQLDTVLNGKVLNDQDLTLFDNNVDKFNTLFDAETISLIKKKARSTNRLDRAEAAMMVIIASKVNQYKFNNDKVVYLPTSSDGIVESEHISNMEKFFGISFAELIAGDYDANDLAESAKQFICPGYQNIKETDIKENSRYDLSDKAARISCAKDVLFMLSGKTLTVGHDGTLLRIITKEDFLKDEYLGDAGNTKFKRDVIDGKITKVKDIAKSGISSKVLDVPISYDPVLTNSHFDETNNEIVLSATSDTFNVMHEITHATQLATKTGVNSELGGRLKTFENLPTSVLNSLDKYISTTFPMVYAFLSSGKLTNNGNKPIGTPDMIYYLLEGELQANATLTTHLFDIGFKWRDDKRTLVAPTKDSNGKEITWSMKANIKAVRAEFKEYVEQRKTEVQEKLIAKKNERKAKTPEGQMSLFDGLDGSDDFNLLTDDAKVNKQSSMFSEDRVLTTLEEAALMQNPDIKEFTKNAYLKRDGDPIIFYRGSRKGHELTSPSKGLFMSTKEYIGTDYADSKISENKIPSLKAYVTNFTKDEVLEIDNKGGVWNRVILDDNLKALTQITTRASISTDTLVDQIFRLHPEIKAIWLRNVVEDPEERGKTGDDLIVNKQYTDGLKSVGIPDQNTFVYAWNRYYDLYKDELGDYSVDKVKEDLYTKFSKLFKQAIDTNDFTRLERAIKVEKGAFDYMKKDISEDKPIKYTKLESEESEKAKRYKKAWNDLYKYDHVYIKVRDPETTKSNLKYFAGQYLNSSVKNFVIGTTKDFDRLLDAIKTEIKKGSLTVSFLKNYIATTNNIKDFTFKAIAKYIYKNDEVAKLNYKQMSDLLDNLNIIVAAARVKDGLDPNAKMTPEEMIAKAKEVAERAKTDAAFAEQYKRAVNFADLLGVIDANGRNKFTSIIPDPAQLNSVFFNHYDGTAESIVDINALGKDIAINQEGEVRPNETYGYKARKRSATTEEDEVYDIKDATLNKALNEIDRQDKITVIREYWYDAAGKEMEAIQKKGMANLTEEDLDKIRNMARNLEMKTQMLTQATDEELNAEYLIAMENETLKKPNITPQITEELEFVRPKLQASPLSKVGSELTRLGNSISGKLNLKRYRSLPEDIQQYFIKDKSKYKFITSKYFNMSLDDRIKLRDTLQQINDSLRTTIAEEKRKVEASDIMARKFKKAQEREARAKQRLKDTEQRLKDAEQRIRDLEERKLSMRDTLNSTTRYRTRIPNQEFSFTNNTAPNKVVNELLKTTWTKSKMSKVQGVVSNREEIVANAKEFFAQNAATLLSAGVADIEQAVDWFINARMDNATDIDFKVFAAIKGYFLSWVLGQTRPGGLYANINTNLKQKIDLSIKELGTISGTLLSILNNMKAEINPFMAMASENIELDGVSIEGELKDKLFKAMESADVEKVQKAIDDIMLYVAENRSTRKSIYRKAVTLRSMSMLSGPLTWLRNKVSNMILKPLHKFTNKIGNMAFKGKTVAGQLKLDKQVTKPIQDYIKQHFIDNKFFDTFITNISKYNPSDIKEHLKTKTGKPTKEAIYANLILKSMYNQYYNDNMFNKDTKTGKFMNELYHKLMRVMSDDKYIREAAIRYFGKILAEHNTDISSGQITDAVMNDLSTALGLAMQDYMHSNNLFNDIEKAISKLGDGWWFMYKTILPFASSSWNWVKGAMKMTPMGLVRAIWNITHLEAKVAKVEKAWSEGRSQISPELTEYMARRDLGAGIIGTVAFIFGAILAGLGYITLEEDDYGTPKLRLGNLVVDVSSIFGTSSILAGAALATGIKEKGWGKDGWLDGINKMVDFWIDDFPIMEIVEMDMYADGGFSMGWKQLESIALSYIPNFLSYFAGATYSGKLKKDTLWKRAVAKLPFFNLLLEREIDPYTGEYAEDDYFKNLINRMVPYFSIDIASQNERKTKQLGLTKKQLNGTYNINGQDFNVTGKDLQDINKAYGLWNAEDLTKFYNNQMKVKVQVDNNKYKTLSYSQMNDKQRKAAVQTIMSNNAEMAKIMAWTKAGNKYYGSANTYVTLRKRGITTNVYKGTKGFVKSK